MKLTAILLISACLQVQAGGFAQNVTISEHNISFNKLLREISRQTEYTFFFRDEFLISTTKISIDVKNASLPKVLDECFTNQPVTYTIVDKTIVIRRKQANADSAKASWENLKEDLNALFIGIKGTIKDAVTGLPLAGASVLVKGTTKSVITNEVGEFELTGLESNAILLISFIGYESESISVKGLKSISLSLRHKVSQMDETVIVAYGTSKVRDITGSISRLTAKEMKEAPMGSSIQSMLQGRAAGVNVAIQSASPTSPVSVIIRGASSLSGNNQPLWVVDGVPDYSSSTSGNVANTLYNLNLSDVESIDILKDASATALYGSRAANGVVIVTTKKGKEGMTPTIEVNARLGLQVQNFNNYKYMTAPDYIDFADKSARQEMVGRGVFDYFTRLYLDEQAFKNLNTSEFDASDLKILPGAYYTGNTDWMKEMTQNPVVQQYDLSLRGGTQNITYYASFFHNNMEGIVKSGGSKIYGGRLNLEAKIHKGLKFGMNLSASSRNTDDKDYMLAVLKAIRPDIPPYNADGTLFTRDDYTENPYTTLLNTAKGTGTLFNGTGYLELNLLKGLMVRTAITNNYADIENLGYKRRGSTFNSTGTRSYADVRNNTRVWENTINYTARFGKSDITVLGGYSAEKNTSMTHTMDASNFPDDDILNNFSSAINNTYVSERYAANALVSQFARAHYKFNNRYIVSGTMRRDGSSRFGPDKRWGTFPSAAVAWIISEEGFMKKGRIEKYVSYLKLRASRGKAGSQNLGNYDWRTNVTSIIYNGNAAIIPNSIGNADLQWEQTLMTDLGLDFGLWNERIRGSFGVYEKLTDALIYARPLPPSTSFSSISSNIGSLKNRGLEFDIKVDVLKKKDLTVTFDFNASTNVNKVIKINGVVKQLTFPSAISDNIRTLEGQRTGQWYGYKTTGRLFVTAEELIALQGTTATGAKKVYRNTYENPGDLYFVDQNKDGAITIDDKVYLGSADPKIYGGFGATLFFRNFMVNTTFTYAAGNKRQWAMPMSDAGTGVGNNNQSTKLAGQSATLLSPYEAPIPRMTLYGDGANGVFSDFWLYDASYLRLNSLNLSYRLPSHLLGTTMIQGVDLTFQATNLFTLTSYPGFDPQGNWSSSSIGSGMGIDNSIYPSSRIYNLGLKLTLK